MSFWNRKKSKDIEEKAKPATSNTSQLTMLQKVVARKCPGLVTDQQYRKEVFERPEYNLAEIRDASEADSYIKISLMKYSCMFFKAGWNLKAENQEAVDYINKRFKMMTICTGKPIEMLFQETTDDLNRYSNAFWVKMRVDKLPGVKATSYMDDKKITAGYTRIDPCTIRIKRDKFGNVLQYEQICGRNRKTYRRDDVIHFYMDKDANNCFGTPRMVAALDDVKLLRKIEGNVAALIYRFSNPLFHAKVGIPQVGFQATDPEINKMKRELEHCSFDGLLITNEKVDLKAIGAEGTALNAYQYLTYFENRVFTALDTSASQMGRGGAKQDADSMEQQIHNTVKYIQRIFSIWIENMCIADLLIEGGFNIFDSNNDVKFVFNEISLDTQIKKENHEMLKYQSNITTSDEVRKNMGMHETPADEGKLYDRYITQKSLLEQIDRTGQWQERLARINSANKAASDSNSDNKNNNGSGNSSNNNASSKRSRNTSGKSTPNKAATNNNRPQNQHGTTSVKVKEGIVDNPSYDSFKDIIMHVYDSITSIEEFYAYENMLTDSCNRLLESFSLCGKSDAVVTYNNVTESFNCIPNTKVNVDSLKNELKENVSAFIKDIEEDSNNTFDIKKLLESKKEQFEDLIDHKCSKAYLYSFIKTSENVGADNVAIIYPDDTIGSINCKQTKLSDINESYNNCTLTFEKKRGD